MTSPGASSVPASIEPIITLDAPAASAFTTSPENFTPPSEMIGTPCRSAARAQSSTAVICGTPTPATTRVVQMEPGPMPHFTASTPALQRSSAASPVATLPATSSIPLKLGLVSRTASMTPRLWPWAVSMVMTSAPALSRAWMRASRSGPTPTAAPQSSRPLRSLAALGCCWTFSMSLMVMRPRSSKASLTTSSFSMRCWCSSTLASSMVTPSRAVTSFRVMTASTVCSRFFSKRRSRLVRMPTSFPRSVTGMPLMPFSRIRATAAESLAEGSMVMGSPTTADSNFFTLWTSAACSSTVRFLWMKPIPPLCAMAMAMRDSVTVSMAAETMGMLMVMLRVRRVAVSTDLGRMSDSAGSSSTSSNVSASFRSSRLSMRTDIAPPDAGQGEPGARADRPFRPAFRVAVPGSDPDNRRPMNGDPGDRQGGDRKPVGLLVRLAYATVADFRLRFAPNLTRTGVFIQTRQPRPVGTAVAFELRLSTGERVVRGEGVVRRVEDDDPGAIPPRLPGMAVQFTLLDAESKAMVDGVVAEREAREVGAGPVPPGATPAPDLSRLATGPVPVLTPPAPAPPTLDRPATTPAPRPVPAQARLDGPHRVEQLQAGPQPIPIPLPAVAEPVTRPSRAVIGIDLGTTNSCAAVVRDGRPYLIPSREGYQTIPSIVALTSRRTLVVGHLAHAQLLTNPAATIHGAKRLLGRPF